MVKLRMQRAGKSHQPFYRIVAAHSTRSRNGAFVDNIGTYNAIRRPAEVKLDEAKALKWLQNGAQPSDTVRSLLRKAGILYKHRLMRRGFTPEQIAAEMEQWKTRQGQKAAAKRVKKTKSLRKKTEAKTQDAAPAAE